MATIYKSKLGPELLIPITLLLVAVSIVPIHEKAWTAIAIIALVVLFIAYIFLSTGYKIEDNKLNIKCGFLIN